MKSLPHLILAGLIAVFLISFHSQNVVATGCNSNSLSWKSGKTPDAQGRLHVNIKYAGGATAPTTTVKGLMEGAVAEWNLYSCKTGIVFDETTSSTNDVEFVYTTDESLTLGCAAYSDGSVRIYHGPNFQTRVTSMNATQARAVFEHELGHFLGLAEHSGSPPNIMNQGTSCLSYQTVPFVMIDDAQDASTCLSTTPSCTPPSPTPTPAPEELCAQNNWFWNFTTTDCHSTRQTCPESCSPYTGNPPPIQEGTVVGPVDYCRYEYGCPEGTSASGGCCIDPTPLLIDVVGNGFSLTDANNGVHFDMGGDGHKELIAWTSPESDDAWLALDRNGNGQIDSAKELFGNFTVQSHATTLHNGFLALAEFDRTDNGGNGDGQIDRRDSVFQTLLLWQDTNHNGISESTELHTLREVGLKVIELNYKESRRTDEYGNRFRYRARVKDTHDAQLGRWAWDVILVTK